MNTRNSNRVHGAKRGIFPPSSRLFLNQGKDCLREPPMDGAQTMRFSEGKVTANIEATASWDGRGRNCHLILEDYG